MNLFERLLRWACVTGLCAGLLLGVLHQVWTTPLIRAAEQYEVQEAESHEHSSQLPLVVTTLMADVATGVGYALLLGAMWLWRGSAPGWQEGLWWGLAGAWATSLAPALGQPPALPGMTVAALEARQLWWLLTVCCAGGGLALLVLRRGLWWWMSGLVLIALPYVIGAPAAPDSPATVPDSLSTGFIRATLATSTVFWCALGGFGGWGYRRWVSAQEPLAVAGTG